MKTFVKTIIAMVAIIIFGLAFAQNTEAAPRYAKNVSDFNYAHRYVLEAAEYPMSQTTKIDGYVATPNASGWMDLKKYTASTAESKYQIWDISNWVYDYDMGELTLPTYTITNSDPLPHWSNSFMGRAITYTSKGFYRQEEIYGEFGTMYEHWNSPAQRYKIVKVRTDAKTGRVVFKFVNVKSGKAMCAGGYAFFYVRIL